MTTTLSPPVRIFAVVGILAATGLAAAFLVMGRAAAETSSAPPTPVSTTPAAPVTTPPAPSAPAAPAAKPQPGGQATKSGYPVPVDRAFRRHGVAVVAVTVPGSPVDAFVRAEARAGAVSARAGFVSLRVTSERAVRTLVEKTGVLPSPAIVVVRRPGVVSAVLGVSDRELVAQAVAQARR